MNAKCRVFKSHFFCVEALCPNRAQAERVSSADIPNLLRDILRTHQLLFILEYNHFLKFIHRSLNNIFKNSDTHIIIFYILYIDVRYSFMKYIQSRMLDIFNNISYSGHTYVNESRFKLYL